MPKSKKHFGGLLDTWGRKNRKLQDKICPNCGKSFRPTRCSSRYCSRPCLWKNNGGHNKKPISWWKNSSGYIEGRIWLADGTQMCVKQHRFFMMGYTGLPLHNDEDVHHINGIKDDNRIENLEIVKHGEHTSSHNKNRKYKKGYKMNLSEQEREARALRAIAIGLNKLGQAAIAKATGGAS